jgi:lipoprotein-anchoring transpeptidase ErfK/SrfK
MGRNARRLPAARVTVGALVAVVATGLLGLGYAQANPQLAAPGLPPAVAGPARPPVERTPAVEPDRDEDADFDSSDGNTDREAPGRLRAAAPNQAPNQAHGTAHRAAPPPDPGRSAGSKPAPPAPPGPALVPGTPCTAGARACVALADRLAWLLDGATIVRGPVPIQHGDAADPTPRGTFRVQWKAEQYTSREYLTQMPYSVFFADGGIAFHEGTHDTPSAGCVKLGHEDAKAFFYFLQRGDEVQIH